MSKSCNVMLVYKVRKSLPTVEILKRANSITVTCIPPQEKTSRPPQREQPSLPSEYTSEPFKTQSSASATSRAQKYYFTNRICNPGTHENADRKKV